MIIGYLDIVGISCLPTKADSPLVVNTDAVLALAVTSEFFQLVPRRHSQVLQPFSCVKDEELPESHSLKIM